MNPAIPVATLAPVDDLDEIVRAIAATIIGEPAWHPAVTVGHIVGSLDHQQAALFADRCARYVDTVIPASIDPAGRLTLHYPNTTSEVAA